MLEKAEIFPQTFIGKKLMQTEVSFTQNDAIVYALGIGFNQDPLKQIDFKYTYQMNQDFSIFPVFGSVFHKMNLIGALSNYPGFPKFHPAMLLHAEQKIQMIVQSLKPNTTYVARAVIKDIVDKGKMTLVCVSSQIYQKVGNQQKLAVLNQTTVALLKFNANGYKGKGNMSKLPQTPKRNFDIKLQQKSYPNQAFLYRLTGDMNPLHIDPKFASVQKLPKPILHGMATKGIISRTLVQHLLNNDATRLKSFHCRFAGHVFPGQSFEIHVWKQENKFLFETICKQRGTVVLKGCMEIRQNAKL